MQWVQHTPSGGMFLLAGHLVGKGRRAWKLLLDFAARAKKIPACNWWWVAETVAAAAAHVAENVWWYILTDPSGCPTYNVSSLFSLKPILSLTLWTCWLHVTLIFSSVSQPVKWVPLVILEMVVWWYLWHLWTPAVPQQDQENDTTKVEDLQADLQSMVFPSLRKLSHPLWASYLMLCCLLHPYPELTGNDVIANFFQWYFKLVNHVKWYCRGHLKSTNLQPFPKFAFPL